MVALAEIRDVAVLDDNPDARDTLSDELRHAGVIPHPLYGPFRAIGELVQAVQRSCNAAVCDHHLIANYAGFGGAEAVASLYAPSTRPHSGQHSAFILKWTSTALCQRA